MTDPRDTEGGESAPPPAPADGSADPSAGIDPQIVDDAEINLLSSPIERTLLNRVFVIGGPLALLIAIVTSLWVSWAHVPFYTVVQTDTVWVPGSTRALRVVVTSERGYDPGRVPVQLTLAQGEQRIALTTLTPVGVGVAQGTVVVPDTVVAGAAQLLLSAELSPEPLDEVLELTIAPAATPREATPVVASVPAQYSNDTEPQPANVKIDLRAHGRVQTGFQNTLYVRITDATGRPWAGPVQVVMIKGELDQRVATPDRPVTLVRGMTDRLGLLSFGGLLVSEIARLQVRVMSRSAPDEVTASRTIMLISFPGVVTLTPERLVADIGQEVALAVVGLSAKRSIYVDVHDGVGTWIETLAPVKGREPPQPWTVPAGRTDGMLQLEAYDQVTAPGESTAVARIELAHAPDTAISLRPLIDAQMQALAVPRAETDFDAARERVWLSDVGALDLTAAEVQTLRSVLIGTLPVSVYGPQTALSTRQRDDAALAIFKARWTLGLRWVLLGGGGLFLLAMTLVMMRAHAVAAHRTRAALHELGDGTDRDLVVDHVGRAQRAALLRGLGIIAVMAAALILAVLMLEAMVWEF